MDTNVFNDYITMVFIAITIAYDGWKQDSKLGYHSAKYKGIENEIT